MRLIPVSRSRTQHTCRHAPVSTLTVPSRVCSLSSAAESARPVPKRTRPPASEMPQSRDESPQVSRSTTMLPSIHRKSKNSPPPLWAVGLSASVPRIQKSMLNDPAPTSHGCEASGPGALSSMAIRTRSCWPGGPMPVPKNRSAWCEPGCAAAAEASSESPRTAAELAAQRMQSIYTTNRPDAAVPIGHPPAGITQARRRSRPINSRARSAVTPQSARRGPHPNRCAGRGQPAPCTAGSRASARAPRHFQGTRS